MSLRRLNFSALLGLMVWIAALTPNSEGQGIRSAPVRTTTYTRSLLYPSANALTLKPLMNLDHVVDPCDYSDINAAVAAIGATPATLLVHDAQTLTANLTIPSTMSLVIQSGGSIIKASTYTLTIDGPFAALPEHVFSGFSTGDVTFGTGSVSEMYAEWWGVDGTADDVQINTALAASANVPVQLLDRTYDIASTVTVGSRVIRGISMQKTVLEVSGSCYGVTLQSYGGLEHLELNGSASATGGIDLSSSSINHVADVRIIDFTNGIGINAYQSLRTLLDHCYITTCSQGVLLTDNTTFMMMHCFINECTTNALDTAGSDSDLYAERCYFESNPCVVAVDLSGASNNHATLKRCGFEDNGESQANPRHVKHSGASILVVEGCSFSAFGSSYTGAGIDLYLEGTCTILRGNFHVKNDADSRQFFKATGNSCHLVRIGNVYHSSNQTISDLVACLNEDVTYKPTTVIENDIVKSGGSVTRLNKSVPYAKVAGDASTSGTGEDDLQSSTIYLRKLGGKGGLRITAAGTRTGSAGNKTIKLHFGSASWTVIPAANVTTDWRVEALILLSAYGAQRISWTAWSGTTITQGYETATVDTISADFAVKMTGECADGGDTITQTMWLVEHL